MRRIGTILSIFALFVAATLFGGQAAAFPSGTLAAAPAAQGTGTPVVALNWVTLRGSVLIDASPVIAKLPPIVNAACEWFTWKLTPLDEFDERSETLDQISVVCPAAGCPASTVVGAGDAEPAT